MGPTGEKKNWGQHEARSETKMRISTPRARHVQAVPVEIVQRSFKLLKLPDRFCGESQSAHAAGPARDRRAGERRAPVVVCLQERALARADATVENVQSLAFRIRDCVFVVFDREHAVRVR